MLQTTTTEHTQPQKGNVLVEFALILPVFLLLIFGMIYFSVALYNKTVLTMATREGARAGVKYVAHRTDAIIDTSAAVAARQVWHNNMISFGTSTAPTFTYSQNSNIFTFTANYTYTGLYVFSDLSISAQTSMKLE